MAVSEVKRPRLDPDDIKPCPTLMIQNLPSEVSEKELVLLFSRYGTVVDLMKVSQGKSCIVEFEDIEVAKMMISESKNSKFYVGESATRLLFANVPHVRRSYGKANSTTNVMKLVEELGTVNGQESMTNNYDGESLVSSSNTEQVINPAMLSVPPPSVVSGTGLPGRVLLFHIVQAVFPITVEVLKTICSASGNVLRISIGVKKADNSLEALVEFESVSEAKHALENLNGADIYSGCCTLSITVSHMPVLVVYKNDQLSMDFTNPNLNITGVDPAVAAAAAASAQASYSSVSAPSMTSSIASTAAAATNSTYQPFTTGVNATTTEDTPFVVGEGVVAMAYNLSKDMNCQLLFNIFCLFGNVARIKFLKTREGCALIQMGNQEFASHAIKHLGGLTMLGQKVEVVQSKQPEVKIFVSTEQTLPDGSPFAEDFINSLNNRFRNAETTRRSRIVAPCNTLHFFNMPITYTTDDIAMLFLNKGLASPNAVIIFPLRSNQKTSIGLIGFETLEDAANAVLKVNHMEIDLNKVGKYHVKFSFSNKGIDSNDSKVSYYNRDGSKRDKSAAMISVPPALNSDIESVAQDVDAAANEEAEEEEAAALIDAALARCKQELNGSAQ